MTTTDRPYTPLSGSLPSQLIGFFTNNPDEELGLEDITFKFDAVRGNIHTTLRLAVEAGLLARDRNADGDYIYKPGKALPKPTKAKQSVGIDALLRATHTQASTAGPKVSKGGHSSPRIAIDFATLQVDDDIPLPTKHHLHNGKWQPLFDKLAKPGQSVALPKRMRGAAGAAVTKINRQKTHGAYRVAMVDANNCRVFRTA